MTGTQRIILFLMLLCGLGCPRGTQAQGLNKAKANNATPIDSMDARQLIAAMGKYKTIAFHSNEGAVVKALGKMMEQDEDLRLCLRFFGKEYAEKQLRQDITDCLYPYYLNAFGGNEEDFRVALAGCLQGDGLALFAFDNTARDLVIQIYKALKAGRTDEAAALHDFLKKRKSRLASLDEAKVEQLKAVYRAGGYAAFMEKTIKGIMQPEAAQSKKAATALEKLLPEVFARTVQNRIQIEQVLSMLQQQPRYLELHGRLFESFFNCNQRAMMGKIKEKCAVWMRPKLPKARELALDAAKNGSKKKPQYYTEERSFSLDDLRAGAEAIDTTASAASEYGIAGGGSLEEMLNKPKKNNAPVTLAGKGKVYATLDQPPLFPGGEGALLAYVAKNVKYPPVALKKGKEGVVVLRFIVLENGRVGDVEVMKGVFPELDAEAVRVVKSLPRFIPGKIQGTPVKVWYTLPVRFKIL